MPDDPTPVCANPSDIMTSARIDHLVVLAADLEQGDAWCERTLGVLPQPGGKHPLMGTHNRLLRIASVAFPNVYLEVIAIDSEAKNARSTVASRWFDMDSDALQRDVAVHGPKLIHFVASVPRIDRGPVLDASRATAAGLLSWRISVRDDGARLFDGALPTVIEWGAVHPAATLTDCGVALTGLQVQHPDHAALTQAYQAIGLAASVPITDGPAQLIAQFDTPRGSVRLCS